MAGRYKPYPEYKDSGVEWLGNIPASWDALPIKRVSEIFNGATPKSVERDYWDGEISWVTPADLGKSSSPYIGEGARSITLAGYESCGTSLVPEGTVILSSRAPIGTLGIATKELCTNQGCKSLIVEGRHSNKYVYYVLFSSAEQLNLLGRGTTFLELSADELGSYKIGLPSPTEQEGIANFLDHETAKIDTLIEKQQQLIQLLKEKRQAVISHAVTKGLSTLNGGPNAKLRDSGVEWLGEVPEHWGIGKVKNLASIISKGTTPSTMGSDFESTGIRFLKAENIGKGFYVAPQPEFYISERTDEQLSRSRLQSHDVLVIIAGATTGQSSVMLDDLLPANTNQAVSFIRPASSAYSSYISYWLTTEYAQSKIWQVAVQAAQPNLSMESLGNIYIPIPPEHELDKLIANINFRILQLSRLTESAELAINLMQERRTALISAAVTGKIDVRDWVAPQASPTHKEVAA
jgi:type I restriction enzyme S subunit